MSGLVVIHGLGVEGQAAARYLSGHTGHEVVVLGGDAGEDLPKQVRLAEPGAEAALAARCDLYLRSPGVPPTDPLYRAALAGRAIVTTPTGYWLSRLAPPGTVTVTGTKGKSTTTALLAAILEASGMTSRPYGNIGRPPLDAELPAEAIPVVELSSYMCHDLPAPEGEPYAHLVTSLYKEHTDWHGGEGPYRAAKLRPYRFEPPCPGVAPGAVILSEVLPEGVRALEAMVLLEDGALSIDGERLALPPLGDAFRSPATQAAARAAAAMTLRVLGPGATLSAMRAALPGWRGLPSRQASVPSEDGRLWIDDALATVPEAMLQALARFADRPLRLVLGGKDRGQDLGELIAAIGRLGDARGYGFGETSAQLSRQGVSVFATMEEAVMAAREDCPSGGVVLFSPAAPSCAPHRDYAERAGVFAALAATSR